MSTKPTDERGFSAVETLLVVVAIAAVGLIGWYVYHVRQTTNSTYNAASSNGAGPAFGSKKNVATGDTSNTALQSDLQSATSAANKGNQDMSSANGSLNDKSTLTSVPQ